MKITKVLQIRDDAPNPVTHLSSYKPTTDYWSKVLRLTNATLEGTAVFRREVPKHTTDKLIMEGMSTLIELEIFPDEKPHTAEEWAEFVMAINHMLWFLNDAPKDEVVEIMLRVLGKLYYKWHDKALKTLKGKDLSRYLEITD